MREKLNIDEIIAVSEEAHVHAAALEAKRLMQAAREADAQNDRRLLHESSAQEVTKVAPAEPQVLQRQAYRIL